MWSCWMVLACSLASSISSMRIVGLNHSNRYSIVSIDDTLEPCDVCSFTC